MKFMLMMNTRPGPYEIAGWSQTDLQAHMGFMKAINAKLKERGEMVEGQGLAAPDQAKLVKANKDGKPVTDGVFAESKEFLAGFWIIDVDSPERAYQIAADISLAPGPGGGPMYLEVEVRQVMSPPPGQ